MNRTHRLIGVAIVAITLATAMIFFGFSGNGGYELDSLSAQDAGQTWQVVDMGSWRAEGEIFDDKPFTGRAFIEQLPAECDLVISPHSETIFYYSCPMDWEPVPDKT